eukprot:TRINITY_DN8091_c0_g2_i2.p1 TRINITY_DN8091_c0_g2~~TRINITY_DN8091_c0_g2_i2.p1  ORF type:complete len:225 (-),score=55.93 TRINITY_DN8091_c0_g2_i2:38-712(-)
MKTPTQKEGALLILLEASMETLYKEISAIKSYPPPFVIPPIHASGGIFETMVFIVDAIVLSKSPVTVDYISNNSTNMLLIDLGVSFCEDSNFFKDKLLYSHSFKTFKEKLHLTEHVDEISHSQQEEQIIIEEIKGSITENDNDENENSDYIKDTPLNDLLIKDYPGFKEYILTISTELRKQATKKLPKLNQTNKKIKKKKNKPQEIVITEEEFIKLLKSSSYST